MAGDPFGDLHGRLGEGELVRLRLELEASRELIEELRKEKEAERAKTQLAEEQVEVLERNLSSLFTTAKLEIKRKDEEIARLRAMLKTAWESLDAAAPADASSAGPGGFGGPSSVAGSRPQAWSGRP